MANLLSKTLPETCNTIFIIFQQIKNHLLTIVRINITSKIYPKKTSNAHDTRFFVENPVFKSY
ncbi:hypothetical protein LSO9J_10096 [Candidatus Liberibacter solanacearum]